MAKAEAQLRGEAEDSREVLEEIERTRAEMDETVDALVQRLRLRGLLDQFLGTWRSQRGSQMKEILKKLGRATFRQIGRHPVPSVMAGASLTWFLLEEPRGKAGRGEKIRYGREGREVPVPEVTTSSPIQERSATMIEPEFESVGSACPPSAEEPGTASRVKETTHKVSEWSKQKWRNLTGRQREGGGRFRQTLSERTSDVKERMRGNADRARMQMDRAKQRATDVFDEYPLIVAVCAVTAGILIGLAIPPSRRERRLFGGRAARLKERAAQQAQELLERGKEVARATASAVKDEAQRRGLTPEGIKEQASELSQKVQAVADRGQRTLESEFEHQRETMEPEFGSDEPGRS
jgi:hypothetical protein